jgi:hypothetical protein
MTRSMLVNETVNARVRRDGGPLCEVEIWHKNGAHGVSVYDPRTAEFIARDVRFAGGRAEVRPIN